ncbi:hypothetical protein HNY73_006388 [Argiope bruennichi]|uniref:Uncharacterized protein n=1 Tax=Argiope bruennichi TaxID=94029 RepID=A0A8T0FKL1_ARGBR|nr:hypothetical protein HNY73_006388 [Argiope bruennichi]
MLIFFIVLYVLTGVQGKAFPSRYKRDYEASYHYIPVEEGIVQLPARYSPENLPNYQDYVPGYIQANGHDWSAYYHQPMVPQPIQDPYSNANERHKMKAEHTWHFIDQNHFPVTQYLDGRYLESDVETPNVIEALVKKEVIEKHGTEYDNPIVVEALVKRGHTDHENGENPAINEFLTIKENPIKYKYDGNTIVMDSIIKRPDVYEYKNKFSNLDLLTEKRKPSVSYDPDKILSAPYDASELSVVLDSKRKKDKAVMVESSTSYYKPIKEKPIKEKPIKEKPIKEKPIKEKPIKEKPIKEKPIKRSLLKRSLLREAY